MKKTIILLIMMLLINDYGTGVFAMNDNVKEVFVNSLVMQIGNPLAYTRSLDVFIDYKNTQVYPFLQGEIVYVPLRFLFEYQGGRVKWDSQTQQVTIYYLGHKYYLFNGVLQLDNQIISMEHPILMKNDRWYVPIVEWNDKILGKQLCLHENYIVLLPKGIEIPNEFWLFMDKYFRDFSSKYGELRKIFKLSDDGTKRWIGLADKNGNVVIEPKYEELSYTPNRPIITKDRQTLICTVMTENEEILFQIKSSSGLTWLAGEPNSLSTIGGFYGDNINGAVYDIIGERADLRVGEELVRPPLGGVPAGSAYVNGLKVEKNEFGQFILKNKSGNILYVANLPENLQFPNIYITTDIIQNDRLMIVDKENKLWGLLDLEGNLVQQ